jgi:hypothetical protein
MFGLNMPLATLANLHWNGPASAAAIDVVSVEETVAIRGWSSPSLDLQILITDDVRSTRLVDRPIDTQILVTGDGGSPKGRARINVTADVAASPSAYDIAQAVHAQQLGGFNTAGSAGKLLRDAGGSGNPWAAELSSNTTPGTFGSLIQKLLTVGKFLGLKG